MEQIIDYIKPELLAVAAVLYVIGRGIRKSRSVNDRYIPLILGISGILICGIWVLASCPLDNWQDAAMALFTAVIQGILVAGLSSYGCRRCFARTPDSKETGSETAKAGRQEPAYGNPPADSAGTAVEEPSRTEPDDL